MICGLCSREQPFANAPCSTCGAELARRGGGARGAHWQGGAGQRDRSMLDARERRKLAGGGKTSSAKATRVGAPKERAAARDERAPATSVQRYHWGDGFAHVETVTTRGNKRTVTVDP